MLSERVPSWRWESKREDLEVLPLPDLEVAFKNLEKMRAFGLMERYESSVKHLFGSLGLPIPDEIPRKMVMEIIVDEDPGLYRVEQEPLTNEVIQIIEQLTDIDSQLYAKAESLFCKRYEIH